MSRGIIRAINGNTLTVSLECTSACATCGQARNCAVAGAVRKEIQVYESHPHEYTVGQEVEVELSAKSMGLSLFLAYILPLIIFLMVLSFMSWLTFSEDISAITALIALVIYYFVLAKTEKYFAPRITPRIICKL